MNTNNIIIYVIIFLPAVTKRAQYNKVLYELPGCAGYET